MKKTLFTIAFMCALMGLTFKPEPTARPIPICHSAANDLAANDMAALALDPDFQAMHPQPLPYTHLSAVGQMITFATPDGKTASGFMLKAPKKSKKWLFVFQEWWGLNDHIKRQAEVFYTDLSDVNVIAIDMYDGQLATVPADAGKLMSQTKPERIDAIIKGAIELAGKKAKIASVGWCFGGMLSLKSAILEGEQAVGCVMYYGRPEKDVEKLKTLNTNVLGIFGSQDKGIPVATVTEFEENMKKANKAVTIKMYDAGHGFANPSNPVFNQTAAEDAYKNALAYLKEKLS